MRDICTKGVVVVVVVVVVVLVVVVVVAIVGFSLSLCMTYMSGCLEDVALVGI